MSYQWKDILQEWLHGQVVDYDPKDVVDAFNDVERVMGSKWLDFTFGQARGFDVAIEIIELGKTLREIENLPNASKVIAKIKENFGHTIFHGNIGEKLDPLKFQSSNRLHEFAHAMQVARLAAHYRRHSLEVKLEPELIVKNKKRHPDLMVKFNEMWVYIEVVCPSWSKEAREIYKILHRISKVKDEIKTYCVVEVYLYKDPSEEEIKEIVKKCKILAQKDLPQECSIENIAQIFINPWNQERLPTFRPAIEEKRPILGFVSGEMKTEKGITYGKKCNVKMPFTDKRAQRILNEKINQLSKEDPGIIVIDVSSVPGGLKSWPELVKRRLQSNLNRRISAVLIIENSITGRLMKSEKVVLKHPNPICLLPENFLATTASSS